MKHTQETKDQISAAIKGKKPAGFYMLKICPVCGVQMNAPNLGRHQPVCEAKAKSDRFPDKSVKEMKTLRRRLKGYGLTTDEYAALWAKQGGICNICGGDNKRRSLAIDHCHKSGAVRGLLCDDCNPLLGAARDSPNRLLRAAEYLRTHGTRVCEGSDCPEFDPFKD